MIAIPNSLGASMRQFADDIHAGVGMSVDRSRSLQLKPRLDATADAAALANFEL